ncbi:hypothetical protein NQS41_10080 [Bacillus sp. C3(2022)]|uniref:hypothetical protein n=1 Tax=Bacillus TaxID=1386 RepID=UPI000DAC2A66|nr:MULTISPECIES: hypothetical protein [Bacillus]MBA1159618.1 hypothetical protein [Bacillus licheniformis]MCU4667628.1 hypothetical protein [Bacillus paralicheniformis]MED4504625.1 hypothetical protein [Bacillus licheniformis]PZW87956.1 hypothetical protein DEU48_101579 [Bacillus sp. AG442]
MSANVKCNLVRPLNKQVRAIYTVGDDIKLELRLDFDVILTDNCGFGGKEAFDEYFLEQTNSVVHKWLCEIGKQLVQKIEEPEIISIDVPNVIDRELITSWEELNREPLDTTKIPL